MPIITLPPLTRRAFGAAMACSAFTMLRSAETSMHWALLSDTHIPADPSNEYRGFRPAENLKKVVPQVVAAKPEGVLICGDVARLEGKTADYEAVKILMEPVMEQTPVAMALGNHDDRKNFGGVLGPAQKGDKPMSDRHVLVVEGPAVRLIVLDSLVAPNSTPGFLGKAQRTWLSDFLKSASDKPTLIFVHHTLDDGDGSLLDAPRLFDIVKNDRKVKAIVFGHSHNYKYDTWEGIHLVNLPAVGYNFRDTEPVGWVDAVFTGGGGKFTLRAIGGNTANDGKTTELKWRS